jgi:ABC-type sugar transport system permease subunit
MIILISFLVYFLDLFFQGIDLLIILSFLKYEILHFKTVPRVFEIERKLTCDFRGLHLYERIISIWILIYIIKRRRLRKGGFLFHTSLVWFLCKLVRPQCASCLFWICLLWKNGILKAMSSTINHTGRGEVLDPLSEWHVTSFSA